MPKDIFKLITISLLLFIIWGCGTMAKEKEPVSVPQKVSIEMPKALKTETNKEKSLAYKELKEDVAYLESLRIDAEINLLFINEVISEIDKQCRDVTIDNICRIPEYELTFVFNKNISESYTLLSQEKAPYDIDDELAFGEIEFIKHANSSDYQYSLTMDTTFESKDTNSSTTVKWSKDKKHILGLYKEESVVFQSNITIDYLEEENAQQLMIADDSYFDKIDMLRDKFHFELLKLRDVNETNLISSSSESINHLGEEEYFDSEGEFSSMGGFLYFDGLFKGKKFQEYERFDKDGNQLESLYCSENLDCDMDDEDSWFED
jgi:Fe-S cluster assembly iron-binding protein IscA